MRVKALAKLAETEPGQGENASRRSRGENDLSQMSYDQEVFEKLKPNC